MGDFNDIEGTTTTCGDSAEATVTISFKHGFTADRHGEFTTSEDALAAIIIKAMKAEGITGLDFTFNY